MEKDYETLTLLKEYHETTKHHFHQTARAPDHIDWENQPHPFRFYEGCETIQLPFYEKEFPFTLDQCFRKEEIPIQPINLKNLAAVLELSMGLSTWKHYQHSEWALRMHPSSGNLHPVETYWITPSMTDGISGIHHYNPLLHQLETRSKIPSSISSKWSNYQNAQGFIIGLSMIPWRESWKYGERALRYCNLDLGHALAALDLAASLQGWSLRIFTYLDQRFQDELFGFHKTFWAEHEKEHLQLTCWMGPANTPVPSPSFFKDVFHGSYFPEFFGSPNQLSTHHQPWEIIEKLLKVPKKTSSNLDTKMSFTLAKKPYRTPEAIATSIITQRRSAQEFDPELSRVSRENFLGVMASCLPEYSETFELLPYDASIHLFLFLHQVDGLEQGLYCLLRNPEHFESLKNNMHPAFLWNKMDEKLPLYQLQTGDYRGTAKLFSCNQDIGGLGAFSLGMLGEFQNSLAKDSDHYSRLLYEAGMIGQVLYLEAEALGLRGTGIGCYYDNAMHELLGIKDESFQDMYHFTVGFPVNDKRVTSKAPYFHLQ